MPTDRRARTYRITVAGILTGATALSIWNAWHFDWLRGYDASANEHYVHIVSTDYRLPAESESGAWHTPPLWFAAAGGLRRLTSALGWEQDLRPGQLLAALAGVAVCVLVFLLARELWPGRRHLHVVALALAAGSPALVRASAMYHPETLAVALATGGLLVAVRALRRGPSVGASLAAGLLLGLASLTRSWALPVLVVVGAALVLEARRSRAWAPALVLVATAAALLVPWLANQQLAHGSPLAFNREAPPESLLDRRPASFYLGHRALRVLDHPVTPLFRNELVPQLYADWWGDWALTWDTPPPPPPGGLLPAHVVADRARQSLVGIVPTVVALAGLLAFAILAAARRSLVLALVPAAACAVAASYLVFAIRYPSTDGDTIKGTYLLMALPAASLGAGFLVDALRRPGRAGVLAVGLGLAVLAAVQAPFLVL